MRNIDVQCPSCEGIVIDHFQRRSDETLPNCGTCNVRMERVYLPTTRDNVIQDTIEGGIWIKHGICNEDGTPKRYDSHSEIRRAEVEVGRRMGAHIYNKVEHIGSPGSDKNRHHHTTRWV